MSALDAMQARVMDLLREALFVVPEGPDVDLISAGLIDSAAFLDLFATLEDVFGIEIAVADLNLEHFHSVARIAAFVASKQATTSG